MKIRLTKEGKIKLSLSLALLLYSLIISIVNRNAYAFLPMWWSTIGDICIMSSRGCIFGGKKTETFKAGIVSFAFAHLTYIAIMQTKISLICFLISFFLFFIVAITAMKYDKKVASAFYSIILILNFVNSIFFNTLAVVGLASFIISDATLAKFEEEDPKWQILIWITYVLAQFSILTSLLLTR